jgi:hypothetical protein
VFIPDTVRTLTHQQVDSRDTFLGIHNKKTTSNEQNTSYKTDSRSPNMIKAF